MTNQHAVGEPFVQPDLHPPKRDPFVMPTFKGETEGATGDGGDLTPSPPLDFDYAEEYLHGARLLLEPLLHELCEELRVASGEYVAAIGVLSIEQQAREAADVALAQATLVATLEAHEAAPAHFVDKKPLAAERDAWIALAIAQAPSVVEATARRDATAQRLSAARAAHDVAHHRQASLRARLAAYGAIVADRAGSH